MCLCGGYVRVKGRFAGIGVRCGAPLVSDAGFVSGMKGMCGCVGERRGSFTALELLRCAMTSHDV